MKKLILLVFILTGCTPTVSKKEIVCNGQLIATGANELRMVCADGRKIRIAVRFVEELK